MEDLVEDARRLKFHASCASFDELRWFAPVTNEVEWEPAEGSYESTGPKGVAHFESGDRIVVGPDHENVPRFYVKNRYNSTSRTDTTS